MKLRMETPTLLIGCKNVYYYYIIKIRIRFDVRRTVFASRDVQEN